MSEIVEGLKALKAKFGKLPVAFRKAVRKAERKAMQGVLQEAQFQVPNDTGKYEDSLKIKTKSTRKFIATDVITTTKDAFYGRFVEYGTKFQEPNPALRRAVDNAGPEALSDATQEIGAEIQRFLTT